MRLKTRAHVLPFNLPSQKAWGVSFLYRGSCIERWRLYDRNIGCIIHSQTDIVFTLALFSMVEMNTVAQPKRTWFVWVGLNAARDRCCKLNCVTNNWTAFHEHDFCLQFIVHLRSVNTNQTTWNVKQCFQLDLVRIKEAGNLVWTQPF